MAEAPSSSLLDLIALRLLNSDGRQIGMATLISPSVALTAEQLVDNHQQYFLSRFSQSGEALRISAWVIARDSEVGFAALSLDSPLTEPHLPQILPRITLPPPESRWESLYYSDDKWQRVSGKVTSHRLFDGPPRILLSLPDTAGSFFGPHMLGAPVIVDRDWLVGFIDESRPYDSAAIPMAVMFESVAWKQVEEAVLYESSSKERVRDEEAAHQVEKISDASSDAPARRTRRASSSRSSSKRQPPTRSFDREAFQARLSSSSLTALTHANGILRAQHQDKMHMEHLIAGLFQKNNGPTRNEFMRAGIDRARLAQIIAEQVGTSLPPENGYPLQEGPALSPLSKHVEEAFQAALAEADQNESKAIRTRHLIRGALSVKDCTLIKALLKEGVNRDRISLEDVEIPPIPRRRPTQAGIKSDDPEGEDLLDIKAEVEALCTVLAAKDVKPPISLGLFGDWGSGKSFFMRKMETRFKELAEVARKGDSAFCGNIVQLWFNAWHYMDTNLWASLATEIFDELAQELARQDALAGGIEDPDYVRAQLIAERATANEAVASAEQVKREADAKLRASELQLAGFHRGDAAVSPRPLDILREGYRFAVQQPEVRKKVEAAENALNQKVEEAAKTLNIDRPIDSVKEQLLELHGIWGYLRAIGIAVRDAKNKRRWLISLALILGIGAILFLALPQLVEAKWLQSAWLQISRWVLVILGAVVPFVPAAHRAVQIIHGAVKTNQESIAKARLEAEKKLQQEHQKLQEDADAAQKTLSEKTSEAARVTERLDNLRADRQITNFIRQRQQSSDYTKYLGVIAKARHDFEQLSTLLVKEQERSAKERDEQRKRKLLAGADALTAQPETTESARLLPRIDRIILYIDDLDRCPEDNVVEVLQAVHLLLAFPLFIVVVGVDPRWLLHSLRKHSQAFREQMEDDHDSEEEQKHWQSTPLNYLEKIFQIPFTLWPMGKSGFGKMVDTLTAPPEPPKNLETPDEHTAGGAAASEPPAATPAVQPPEVTPSSPPVAPETPDPVAVETVSWWSKLVGSVKRIFGFAQPPEATPPPADETSAAPARLEETEKPTTEPGTTEEKKPAAGQTKSESTTAAIDPNPEHLQLESWERAFMKELHELIPSPRATKRFINIYRLIRASVDLDERLVLEEFIGNEKQGKYRAALLLLAILTGYPDQAAEILRELVVNKHTETWWQFIDSFKQRAETPQVTPAGKDAVNGKRTANAVAKKGRNATKTASEFRGLAARENLDREERSDGRVPNAQREAEAWAQLLKTLESVRHIIEPTQSCDDFVEWAPKVARYSFQSGRVLLTRGASPGTQKSTEEGKRRGGR
jgi:KAP family P-loop domain/Clp amino terminal domain, pathogenicity island component